MLGYQQIVGLDEVGRGAIAGPMVVAAVEIEVCIPGVTDSKLLSATTRTELANQITTSASQVRYGSVSNQEIDELGVGVALTLAYNRALEHIRGDILLTDFTRLPGKKHILFTKGDLLYHSIAAASIIAKVYRDRLMGIYHQVHPEYSWDQNVGYGTKTHFDSILHNGLSPLHRKTFLRSIDL